MRRHHAISILLMYAFSGIAASACDPPEQQCTHELSQDVPDFGDGLGYLLSPEVMNDLPGMYKEIEQHNSCLNRVPQGSIVCEFFQYVPCQERYPAALQVDCVPKSCTEPPKELEPFIGTPVDPNAQWCLVGPHFEGPKGHPDETDEVWCAGTQWFESSSALATCDGLREELARMRERGTSDLVEACSPVPHVEMLEACFNYFCSGTRFAGRDGGPPSFGGQDGAFFYQDASVDGGGFDGGVRD